MTNREFYQAIVNGTVTPEVQEFATQAIKKLNDRNEARKGKTSNKKAEVNDPIKQAIIERMEAGTAYTASVVFAEFGLEGAKSVQHISRLLQELRDEGKVTQSDVSVKGKGKQKGYTLVTEK